MKKLYFVGPLPGLVGKVRTLEADDADFAAEDDVVPVPAAAGAPGIHCVMPGAHTPSYDS